MNPPRTIVFDLDDTLIETSPRYQQVLERFAECVAQAIPTVGRAEALALQDEIDIEAAKRVGFDKSRFPWSLAETYRVLAKRAGGQPAPETEQSLVALGYTVFDEPPELCAGAADLLTELKGVAELLLYTLGVPEVQQAKVLHHGFDRVFDEVHIVPRKTTDALRAVLGERVPAEVMVVGDSLRGEVAPAVALGCRAVHIKRPVSWAYHHAEVDGAYQTIERISDLRGLVLRSGSKETA